MSELTKILAEEYDKQTSVSLDPNMLIRMIEEILEVPPTLNEERGTQTAFDFGPGYEGKTIEFTYRAIPEIPISELGWASLNSNDRGTAAKRSQLEQFLGTVEGSDMRQKIKDLNRFLNDPAEIDKYTGQGASDSEKIARTLSYLVFFKTLTEIITNFNASSAGFSFESFLAVLLGGGQIATGNKTIADLTDENGVPISLKLYSEKTVKAGGSWTDLVNDLTKASARSAARSGRGEGSFMQYLVATKALEGEGLETTGEINFYQYVLTLENIVQIMANSADEENHFSIRLPEKFVSGTEDLMSLEKPSQPTQQDIEAIFVQNVQSALGDMPNLEAMLQAIDYSKNKKLFKGGKIGLGQFAPGNGKKLGWDGGVSTKAPIVLILQDLASQGLIPEESLQQIHSVVHRANEIAAEKARRALELYRTYREGAGPLASPEASVQFYNKLTGPEKQRALLFTAGYQARNQYELRKWDIKNIAQLAAPFPAFGSKITGTRGQKEVWIGKLEIGRAKVQEMLNAAISDLNKNVFILFDNLKLLNDSLQAYFAGAMEDNDLANTAIDASMDISKKTAEIKPN